MYPAEYLEKTNLIDLEVKRQHQNLRKSITMLINHLPKEFRYSLLNQRGLQKEQSESAKDSHVESYNQQVFPRHMFVLPEKEYKQTHLIRPTIPRLSQDPTRALKSLIGPGSSSSRLQRCQRPVARCVKPSMRL
jgi:hypothetical protein